MHATGMNNMNTDISSGKVNMACDTWWHVLDTWKSNHIQIKTNHRMKTNTHPYMCGYIHAYMHAPTNINPHVCIRIYIGSRKQHEATCTPSDTCTHKAKTDPKHPKSPFTWFTWKVNHPNHSSNPNTKSYQESSRYKSKSNTKSSNTCETWIRT